MFPNTLNQESVFLLKLKNTTSAGAAFKVKTTAPKNYLVKPSAGVIPGNGTLEVKITLNKQTVDPSSNNDRFLVQAVKSESGKELTREEWLAVDRNAVQELRLHVTFANAASVPAPVAKDASPDQVRAKYEELVSYCSQVEKDKRRVEAELETLKSQGKKKSSAKVANGGFTTIQLIVAMLLAVIIARFATIMGY